MVTSGMWWILDVVFGSQNLSQKDPFKDSLQAKVMIKLGVKNVHAEGCNEVKTIVIV